MSDVIDTIIDKEEQGSVQGAFDWYNDHLWHDITFLDWGALFSDTIRQHRIKVKHTKNPITDKKLVVYECSCGEKYYMVDI